MRAKHCATCMPTPVQFMQVASLLEGKVSSIKCYITSNLFFFFLSRIVLYLAPSNLSYIITTFSVNAEKHPCHIMPPFPCFIQGLGFRVVCKICSHILPKQDKRLTLFFRSCLGINTLRELESVTHNPYQDILVKIAESIYIFSASP